MKTGFGLMTGAILAAAMASMPVNGGRGVDILASDFFPPPRQRRRHMKTDVQLSATAEDLLGKSHGKGMSKRARQRAKGAQHE